MSAREKLTFLFVLDALDGVRFDPILAAVESTLPTPPLKYEIDRSGHLHEVEAPSQWFVQRISQQRSALLCNGDEARLVSLSAFDALPHVSAKISLSISPCPPSTIERPFELMCLLGPATTAYAGSASTVAAGARIAREYHGSTNSPVPRPLPPSIGWINYWSPATCALLHFTPDDSRGRHFARYTGCKGGGVAFQLTDRSLDLDDPRHRSTLDATYEAFPEIRNRVVP